MHFANKSNNVIFFLWDSEFSKRDYIRFGIKGYEDNGWIIKVLVCEPFFFQNIYSKSKTKKFSKVHKNIIVCKNIMEVLNNLLIYKPSWTIDFATSISKNNYIRKLILLFLFSIFSKRIILNLCRFPDPIYSKRKIGSNIGQFFKKLIFKIAQIPWYIFQPHKVAISGLSDYRKYKSKSIPVHNLDYDLYLIQNSQKLNSNNKNNIALFLDEDAPFHSDYLILGIEPEVKADEYYEEINNMLEKIRNKFKFKIFIQLHPRAEKNRSSFYYKHKFSKLKTAASIKNSKLVIGHCSTSLQLAILFKKPIILIRTKGWRQNDDLEIFTKAFSKALNIPIYTKNGLKNLKKFPKINQNLYSSYIDNYVKFPGSEEKFSWEIISNHLKNFRNDSIK